MVKKSKKKGGPRPKPQRDAGPNMFERLGNKKRFDVLGRKTKGDVRSINKLRSAATEKRKSTLLVEYRQLRKSNAFIDRRFGEDDDSLTAEERALLRFQKQRMRDMAGSKFTLGDDDAGGGGGEPAQLTHLGRSLAEDDGFGGGGWGFDDDGGDMDDDMTRALHFGGGFVPAAARRDVDGGGGGGGDRDAPAPRKSKKEVMEEIIAKSKMHKALKSQQRDEDVAATEALDAAFASLAQGGALAGLVRPKGEKPDPKAIPQDDGDRRFDVMTRELIFEAKAAPGERTLTAEELADLERARLEELERARVKRQRGESDAGGDDLGDDFGGDSGGEEAAAAPAGGYAARRAKRARAEAEAAARDEEEESDEEDGSDSDGSGSGSGSDDDCDDGLTALERRRRDRAAGDHPLQDAFRGMAAKLLAKHGLAEPAGSDDDGEEGSGDGSSGSEGEEEEGSGSEEKHSGSESEEEEEEEEGSEGSEEGEEEAALAVTAKAVSAKAAPAAAAGTLTFTPALPGDYADFAAAASGLSAADLGELLRRMRGFNAAALATDGRKRTQVLYGCLVQHYVTLVGGPSGPALAHLDALLPHVLELTPQVPFYAATLARARLGRAQEALAARLKDPLLRAQAWPGAKTLLLLKLYTAVYPVSDKRHPVLTPAGLLATAALTLCPLTRPRDVAAGLFLAALAAHMHAAAGRYCPEPLHFAAGLLRDSFAPAAPRRGTKGGAAEEDAPAPRWLALTPAELAAAPATDAEIEDLSIGRAFGPEGPAGAGAGGYLTSPAFKSAAAAAAVRLIGRTAATLGDMDALPEAMAPALEALRAVARAGAAAPAANGAAKKGGKRAKAAKAVTSGYGACVAPGVAALAARVLSEVEAAVAAAAAARRPLANPALAAVPQARQFNPRFEENFATGKDFDPDRERSERRRLQRELRREERGAARELRRDAAFMAGVRDREKAALHADLESSARRAKAFLQQQAADAKSGGQGGMWKKKRNK